MLAEFRADPLKVPLNTPSGRIEIFSERIAGFGYAYDRMGNKLAENKLHDPADDETASYDSLDRLVGFHRPGGI